VVKTSVARRYAKALLDLLDEGSVEATRTGLTGLAEAYAASSELRHVLRSPAFGFEQKQAVLIALSHKLGCPPVVDAFLGQLLKKNRVNFIQEIADAFTVLADQAKGTQPVAVHSAKPMSQSEQEGLGRRLRDLLRREVDLTFHTDPALLAGIQLRIASTLVDSSARSRLDALKSLLTRE
jgi:F-type H+-transporting ATPase subunit delta